MELELTQYTQSFLSKGRYDKTILCYPGGECPLSEAYIKEPWDGWDKVPAIFEGKHGYLPGSSWIENSGFHNHFLYNTRDTIPFLERVEKEEEPEEQTEEEWEERREIKNWKLVPTGQTAINLETGEPAENFDLAYRAKVFLTQFNIEGEILVTRSISNLPLTFWRNKDYPLFFIGTAASRRGLYEHDSSLFFFRFFTHPIFNVRNLNEDWLSTDWSKTPIGIKEYYNLLPNSESFPEFLKALGIEMELGEYNQNFLVGLRDGCWTFRLHRNQKSSGARSLSSMVSTFKSDFFGATIVGSIKSCSIKLLPGEPGNITGYIDHGGDPSGSDEACYYTAAWSATAYPNLIPIKKI